MLKTQMKDELASRIDVDLIREHVEAMFPASARREHAEVLAAILDNLSEVDFHDLAGIDPTKPVPLKTQIVLTVSEVLRVARDLDCGLCRNAAFIYTYNGEFWQLLDKDGLEGFLGEAAEKLGMHFIDARHFETKAKLGKQFLADAHLPTPERGGGSVLINLRNGTYEFGPDRFVIRDPDPNDFLTYQLPFEFDEGAACPKWQAFLDEVLPDADRSRQKILAEFVGYVFARHLKLEKCLILYGSGANGKSVVFEVISELLGPENVASVSLESLSKSEYYRATLANKLLNYSSEISTRLQAEKFKQLTSGEPIEARLPYGQPMTLRNYARLAFNSNELPRDVEHSEAFFRRFLILPFEVTIPVDRRDPNLAQRIIKAELSGVFNWVLQGLTRLLKQNGFTRSAAVDKALDSFRRESDSVAMFVEDEGYQRSARNATYLKALYQEYRTYCYDNGFRQCGSKTMAKRLEALGFDSDRGVSGRRFYLDK